ncbi:MAG: ADP-ribosylglycohydrolase family protein [Opitutaceae bacterium]|jgi:ADP-ribosylglycohydrolase
MTSPSLPSRIFGCWLGKSIGGTLGLPAEGRMDRLHFSFYDPVPTIAPPNDDLELQLVWLHLLETLKDGTLTQQDFADAWLNHLHYMWDEYGRCRWNLRRGVPVAAVGTFENNFVSGMGSPIRSEIWACLFPGDPASAAYYAALDASLDHGVEGIAGEVLFSIMQCLAADGTSVADAITAARARIPADCETARALQLVADAHHAGVPVWDARDQLLAKHGSDNFTHTPLNVGLTIWALLYGKGDFEKSILLAVNGGYDTDCTAATVGATIGFALGAETIPDRWCQPIGDGVFVGDGIIGIKAAASLGELTDRTIALIGKLKPKTWADLDWSPVIPAVDLAALPGTISLRPLDGSAPVLFANGELPASVKTAGGAEWDWTPAHPGKAHFVVALARAGAQLFIDGQSVVNCPAGEPYVPATHRPAAPSRAVFKPSAGSHRMRIELGSRDANQDATVLLAYANLHIAPWTATEVPHPAQLPDSPTASVA